MKLPTIQGVIRRRLLLNYRIDPEVAADQLPKNFRPKLHNGFAIAGICLIRLEEVRPSGFPKILGISSENAAHRYAVTWQNDKDEQEEGVFVPRRDSNSSIVCLAGGRIFPGYHYRSRFEITDLDGMIKMQIEGSEFDSPTVRLQVREADQFPENSIFESLAASSKFFENGSTGYSFRPHKDYLEGLYLDVPKWVVTPLQTEKIESAYFDDKHLFPEGSIEFDHALLMRDIEHSWHERPIIQSVI